MPEIEYFENKIISGDSLVVLSKMPDNSIDSIVTDPPYGLSKEPNIEEVLTNWLAGKDYEHRGGGFMGKCYHPDTEVLTVEGWKQITAVNDKDIMASLNPQTHLLEYVKVKNVFKYFTEEPLIHIKHRSAEQLVTKNHNVYYGKGKNKAVWGVSRADELPKSSFYLSNQVQVVKDKIDKVVNIGNYSFNAEDFCYLVGLFLGDGYVCVRKGQRRGKPRTDNWVGFSVKKERKKKNIQDILERLQIKYNYRESKDYHVFEITDDVLISWFQLLGKCDNKYIPRELLELGYNSLYMLYKGLIDTDGHIQKGQYTYVTSSKQLSDDFQELCLKIGLSCSITLHREAGDRFIYGKMCDCKKSYRMSVLPINKKLYSEPRVTDRIKEVPYEGEVYCVELEHNHILYTRYDGKPVWSGNSWDSFVPGPATWKECYRVLKSGGYILVFAGTRTVDLMGISLRLAGFEIRDQINWVYGSGFPKSANISKNIDKMLGTEKIVGKGKAGKTALGQSSEWNKTNNPHEFNITEPNSPEAKKWEGYGTALKPAHEPIVVARKPIEGTVANNVLKHGCGGLNIDQSRISPEVPVHDASAYTRLSCHGSGGYTRISSLSSVRDTFLDIVSALRSCNSSGKVLLHNAGVPGGNPKQGEVFARNLLDHLFPNGVWCGLSLSVAQDYQGDCPACRRFCDEQFHRAEVCAQESAPSLAGVLEHICSVLLSPDGIPGCQCIDRPSSSDAVQLILSLFKNLLSNTIPYLTHPVKGEDTSRKVNTAGHFSSNPIDQRINGGHTQGRFPANLIHDGSEEVVREFPHGKVGARRAGQLRHTKEDDINFTGNTYTVNDYPASEGSAARFFKSCPIGEEDYSCIYYCAKASKKERNLGCEDLEEKQMGRNQSSLDGGKMLTGSGNERSNVKKNNHPTVKPLSLMRYLVRLVTPPDGMVLDPFAGSGTTLMAAKQEGFKYVGIELGEEYAEIAKCRVNAVEKVEKVIDEIQMSLEDL